MFDTSAPNGTSTSAVHSDQPQLLRLNVDFLKLLIKCSGAPSNAGQSLRQQLNLSTVHAAALEQCSETGLQRMATCGFSLFSLSLHRADIWQQAATRSAAGSGAHYGPTSTLPNSHDETSQICTGFVECALFFAWHLAQQQPRDARLLLGMSEDCAVIVARLELWQCRQIAQTHSRLLSPRWRHHGYFWTDLLRYGSNGDLQHFKFARLLGSQLMAQDLEPSAILHLSNTDS